MSISKALYNYLNTGVKDNRDPDATQRIVVANIFSLLGTTITGLFGITALLNAQYLLATVLLINCLIYFFSHLTFRFEKLSIPYHRSANLLTFTVLTLVIYLVYSGGVGGTGPLWIYLAPPVVLFFGGLKKGGRNLAIFVTIIGIQLFYPEPALLTYEYSYEFKSRLLYSFITVSMLFAVYEAARHNSYQTVIEISQKFEQQAMHDPLSGLPNRRGMMSTLELEYARSKRGKLNMAVIMCDIDHFKSVNDVYGHDKGDEVIKRVGQVFVSELRKQDTVCRWGGEEYLLLLPTTTESQAMTLAEKLRKKLESIEFTHNNKTFSITVSMGVHQFTTLDTIDDAINAADANLYRAKSEGRNRCIC